MKIINTVVLYLCFVSGIWLFPNVSFAQQDDATIILDLKKSKAEYEVARQKYENNKRLLDEKAISTNDFNQYKNEFLSKEVDYQKLILRLISQQSYVLIQRATKYQDAKGNRRVKVVLKNSLEGNEEYIGLFKDHFDVFTPEMQAGKVYNIFVSLVSLTDQVTIGLPYEQRVSSIELGKESIVDFQLLKDMDNLQVVLNYNGKKDLKNIFLEKDATINSIDVNSLQFSKEADLSSLASYDLTFEQFSSGDETYRIMLFNLPKQISYDLLDIESKVSQIKFAQGTNVKKMTLKVYLPDRDDSLIQIDKPIAFYCAVLTDAAYSSIKSNDGRIFTESEIKGFSSGFEKLEIIPRGKGKIEIKVPNLYHEINLGESLPLNVTVRNSGSRRLDNIKISLDMPLGWKASITPDVIKELEPNEVSEVSLIIIPSEDEGVGAQEVKINTEALVDNRAVDAEVKGIRVQIEAGTSVVGIVFLILLLLGIVAGVVVAVVKLSKR